MAYFKHSLIFLSALCFPLSLFGWAFFDGGHTDLRTNYDPIQQNWSLQFDRGEFGISGALFMADEAAIIGTSASELVIPSGISSSFDFLGAEGDSVWVLPVIPSTGVVFMGFNQNGVPGGIFSGGGEGQIAIELVDFQGPGDFFLYTVQEGQAILQMDTRPEAAPFGTRVGGAGGHGHSNWAFTQKGVYFLTFQPSGTRLSDGVLTKGEPTTFAFLIDPEPIDVWRFEHFGFQFYDPLASNRADPDGDGLPNVLEYALGLDPLHADREGEPTVEPREFGNETYLNLTYRRPADRDGLRYEVQVSSDLVSWRTLETEETVSADADGTPLIHVRDDEVLREHARRFMRLSVTDSSEENQP